MCVNQKRISVLLSSALLALTLCAVPAFTSTAFALSLQQAKQQGLVGEQPNGYLAAVQPSAEVTALVNQINSERRKRYQSIAKKNGTALQSVEQLAGRAAIQKTAPGQYYRDAAMNWQRK